MAKQLPKLIDDLIEDGQLSVAAVQSWLAREQDVQRLAKVSKQFSAAHDSLRKCRDGEAITLEVQNKWGEAKVRCQPSDGWRWTRKNPASRDRPDDVANCGDGSCRSARSRQRNISAADEGTDSPELSQAAMAPDSREQKREKS